MLSEETVRRAEEMLAAGAEHFIVARDLRIPLTSVEWIQSGRHPRQRQLHDNETVRQRMLAARRAMRRGALKC